MRSGRRSPGAGHEDLSGDVDERPGFHHATGARLDRVIVAAYVRRIEGQGRPAVPPHIAKWIDELARKEKVIVVALGNPYLIRQFPNVNTYVVTYGVGDALERSAAAVVVGRAPATGTAPVSLPGFFKRGNGLRVTGTR